MATGDQAHMQEAAERHLVEQAAHGDMAAFNALMQGHQERVYSLAFKMTQDHESADTVTQDVFVKAFRGLSGFAGGSRLMTWLYTITMRSVLDQQRARRRQLKLSSLTENAEVDNDARRSTEPNPAETMEYKELGEALRRAIKKLPEDQRAALLLVTQEGFSYREAAETLGITTGTIAWQVWKARQRLKSMLSPYLKA